MTMWMKYKEQMILHESKYFSYTMIVDSKSLVCCYIYLFPQFMSIHIIGGQAT